MRMRQLISIAMMLVVGVLPVLGKAPVPRKSPEFKFKDNEGKDVLLSSFKGKVVMVEFIMIRCPHCLRVAETMNSLDSDLSSRGFKPIVVAFDSGITDQIMNSFVEHFKVTYTVGYTSSDKVDSYLGRSVMERFQVPQIVVIDRSGVIRAQSSANGDMTLENMTSLHRLIDGLLKESA
jgi:cytochrome c biogenesis protein CcmG/thiol:disulfide interchange protein DsbE